MAWRSMVPVQQEPSNQWAAGAMLEMSGPLSMGDGVTSHSALSSTLSANDIPGQKAGSMTGLQSTNQ